ncbi:MAG: type II 3-dehydroquinate dehydratase [Desulfobacterales bacterium]|jgi:3-dehydroquinate dehydratase-2|nr:type II 3-dehydroquinate dehydratase [Desulfobacterales bacterium]
MRKVLVIHGPNLNLLGVREPDTYGAFTLDEINLELKDFGEKIGLSVDAFQSNHEGEIVEKIQSIRKGYNALVINPAAYTHTSIAIRDALLLLDIPTVEVHLSNIYKREPFRQKSMIADVVNGQIAGFGKHGYLLALQAVLNLIS